MMMNSESIAKLPLLLDARTLQVGGIEPAYLRWDYLHNPHFLVIGATGSGKTYFVKLLLGRIATHLENAQVVICDYKHDDFRFLDGAANYYAYNRCKEGLDFFYDCFQNQQQKPKTSRIFRLLIFDEWASYLSMLDKKCAESAKNKLATLLMLGRSYNFHVLVSQQRADASYFSTARDQFSCVCAFGNLSREGKDMFFSGFKDKIRPVYRLGEGYLLINGVILHHVQVPRVRNPTLLEDTICKLMF